MSFEELQHANQGLNLRGKQRFGKRVVFPLAAVEGNSPFKLILLLTEDLSLGGVCVQPRASCAGRYTLYYRPSRWVQSPYLKTLNAHAY
jgi:hypothetical protein